MARHALQLEQTGLTDCQNPPPPTGRIIMACALNGSLCGEPPSVHYEITKAALGLDDPSFDVAALVPYRKSVDIIGSRYLNIKDWTYILNLAESSVCQTEGQLIDMLEYCASRTFEDGNVSWSRVIGILVTVSYASVESVAAKLTNRVPLIVGWAVDLFARRLPNSMISIEEWVNADNMGWKAVLQVAVESLRLPIQEFDRKIPLPPNHVPFQSIPGTCRPTPRPGSL